MEATRSRLVSPRFQITSRSNWSRRPETQRRMQHEPKSSDQAGQPTGHVISPLPGVGLCLVAVCKDHKLRVWSLSSYECVMASDLVQFTAEAGRQMMGGSQGHRVSLGKILFCDNLLHTDYLCYSFMNAYLFCAYKVQVARKLESHTDHKQTLHHHVLI